MKRLLLLFGVYLISVKIELAQAPPTFPASPAQTTAGVVGAPFYLTPFDIQYIPFIATNLNPSFVTNLVNGSSNLLHATIALEQRTNASTVSAGANVTITLSQNSDGSTNYAMAATGGGGGLAASDITNALYLGTNKVSLTNAIAGTLPSSAADSSWMSITNAVAITNQPTTIGQALVVVGTNVNGATMVKGTNWPSGGSGSDTPWSVNHNASGFRLDILTGMSLTNSGVASGMPFILGFDSTYGVALTLGAFTNDVAALSALVASNIVGGTLVSTKGSVSLIPTNGAPVYTSNGLTGALPYGLTNTLQGRCQYLVGYYLVDAVGGTPILTVSNELDGYKYPNISVGASASVTPGTNWFTTPILSSNAVLRIRDESAGTGASVGLISSKQIGL